MPTATAFLALFNAAEQTAILSNPALFISLTRALAAGQINLVDPQTQARLDALVAATDRGSRKPNPSLQACARQRSASPPSGPRHAALVLSEACFSELPSLNSRLLKTLLELRPFVGGALLQRVFVNTDLCS